MKLLSKCLIAVAMLLALPLQMSAANVYSTPKQEIRSAWVATVWKLDWPQTVITKTGDTKQIAKQKQEMIELLDSMAANNMNAVNFQVRSRCDAMYKSSYEPWSSDLVAKRGMDPGYDPLAFVVEECHKRGLECHAWINPYRYESQVGQWNEDDPNNYRKQHPDWLLDVNGASILNPGRKEVVQRITDICREIITNYDVDGILYDDYFYLADIKDSDDADLYSAYKNAGGTMSLGDWRRDNVNRMVKSVYNMIQTVKPWVRFGISPAGVACTSSSVANKYGIKPCPSGSDWQYNDIYSDPIAWLNDKSIDFISPQIYWTIGNTTNYEKIAPWWSEVAAHFGRHFYSSHSITSLNTLSNAPETSGIEHLMITTKASGPNNTKYSEYANEIELNRTSSLDNSPGSIFYSAKYLYRKGNTGSKESFAHYLKRTTYTCKSLIPAMTWKTGNNPGAIKNLTCEGNVLKWDAYDNVRYTVYAVSNSVKKEDFAKGAESLIGISYSNSFEIPSEYLAGYRYAVCVYDRVGNEYEPTFYNAISTESLAAPVIAAPADGAKTQDPFDLSWSAVDKATVYFVDMAHDADFKDMIKSVRTTATQISSSAFIDYLNNNEKVYWRVRACAAGYNDGVSATKTFFPQILSVIYPADGATDVNPVFTATWNLADGKTPALVEIAADADFSNIVFSAESVNGSADVPVLKLKCITTYYIRVKLNGKYSRTSSFSTAALAANVPVFTCPASDGATVYADNKLSVVADPAARSVTVEVSTSPTTWSRTRYVETLPDYTFVSTKAASQIKTGGAMLADGKTYYVRARASYYDTERNILYTSYSTPISFVYNSKNSGVENIVASDVVTLVTGDDAKVIISAPTAALVSVKAYSLLGTAEQTLLDGVVESTEVSLADLPRGMHLITVSVNGSMKTFKFVK